MTTMIINITVNKLEKSKLFSHNVLFNANTNIIVNFIKSCQHKTTKALSNQELKSSIKILLLCVLEVVAWWKMIFVLFFYTRV